MENQKNNNNDFKLDNQLKNTENTLSSSLKRILNILRDSEHISGLEALRPLSQLIVFRLLSDIIKKGSLNIDNSDSYKTYINPKQNNHYQLNREKLLKYLDFDLFMEINPSAEKHRIFIRILKFILSQHNKLCYIYPDEKCMDSIKDENTYMKIFKELSLHDFSSLNFDIMGFFYEQIIKNNRGNARDQGQFFTPHNVRRLLIQLSGISLNDDGTSPLVLDPAAGVSGILCDIINLYKSQSQKQNIDIDWNQLRNDGINGNEVVASTHQLGYSNLFINSGCTFNNVLCQNSLKDIDNKEYDYILTNPPFGINIDYNSIPIETREKYFPIKTKDAASLFLQMIIHKLKIGGVCCLVFPYGRQLSSAGAFVKIRKMLLKTCNVTDMVCIPNSTFENTGITTVIIKFIKHEESNEYKTKNIKFWNYDGNNKNLKIFAKEIQIDEIIKNGFSMILESYLNSNEQIISGLDKNIKFYKLGEICDVKMGGTPSRSNDKYWQNGQNPWVSVEELNGGFIYDTKEKITDFGVK